ncbi:hypothetical protein GLP21_12080 [Photobacterium carnosum]|nr:MULTISPECIES: hypothetical protein [Photobacterium]MCD9543209.1 hypothetical protein [Photobacterium carnosum]MCD9547002.1 hypothetical protein [Photobacterium carnosum]MCD9549366.1 hypothetical protein [Photobacterium carnosum]MCD9553099.1 hypothetical protein [Photobacterium carnosum]MCF2306606.1 hypothetical protein [Photobacterium carnosum]
MENNEMTAKMFTNYISNSLVALGYAEYKDETLINWSIAYCQSDYVGWDSTYLCNDSIIATAKRLLTKTHSNYVKAIERIITSGKYIEMKVRGKRVEYSSNSLTALQETACETLCECIADELEGLKSSFKRDGYAFLYDANVSDTEIIYDRTFGDYKIQVTKENCEDLYLFHDPENEVFNMSQIRSFIDGKEMYLDSEVTLLKRKPECEEYSIVCQTTISSVICDKSLSDEKLFHFIYKEYVELFADLISEGRRIMGIERPERDIFFQSRYIAKIEIEAKQQREEESVSFWRAVTLA